MATIQNIPDRAGATRDTLQKLVRLQRARGNTTEEYAGYKASNGKEVMRKRVEMGALASSSTTVVAHGIGLMASIEKVEGVAHDMSGATFVKAKPMGDAAFADILVDATNITLTTVADQTAYELSQVTIEYTLA